MWSTINNIISFCEFHYIGEVVMLSGCIGFFIGDFYGYFDVPSIPEGIVNTSENISSITTINPNATSERLVINKCITNTDALVIINKEEKKNKNFCGILMSGSSFDKLKHGVFFLNGLILLELLGIGEVPRILNLFYIPWKLVGGGWSGLTFEEQRTHQIIVRYLADLALDSGISDAQVIQKTYDAMVKASQRAACQAAIVEMSIFKNMVQLFAWRMGIGYWNDYRYFCLGAQNINPYNSTSECVLMLMRRF